MEFCWLVLLIRKVVVLCFVYCCLYFAWIQEFLSLKYVDSKIKTITTRWSCFIDNRGSSCVSFILLKFPCYLCPCCYVFVTFKLRHYWCRWVAIRTQGVSTVYLYIYIYSMCILSRKGINKKCTINEQINFCWGHSQIYNLIPPFFSTSLID